MPLLPTAQYGVGKTTLKGRVSSGPALFTVVFFILAQLCSLYLWLLSLGQGSANYGPQAKVTLPPVLINKVL